MKNISEDFKLFGKSMGINSNVLNQYKNFQNAGGGYINPSILEERELNVTQLDVFSRLMLDRIIWLGTPIDDTVSNIIQAQLLYLESVDSQKDIHIYINSPGGSVYSGLGLVDNMNYIDSDVSTICTGMAASMGAIILSNGSKGKRRALRHSRVMIHQPLGGAEGQASDIEITANEILKVKKEIYTILSENTGKSYEQIENDSDRDHWLTAQESKDYGIIDEVLYKDKK